MLGLPVSAKDLVSKGRRGRPQLLGGLAVASLLLVLYASPWQGGGGRVGAGSTGGLARPGGAEVSHRALRNTGGMADIAVALSDPDDPRSDARGWMTDPLHKTIAAGNTAATSCVDLHVGTINPGHMRGNHRHNDKNETIMAWGARARWRVEVPGGAGGFVEREQRAGEMWAVPCPHGVAHGVRNIDAEGRELHLVACADLLHVNANTDYNVWSDFT